MIVTSRLTSLVVLDVDEEEDVSSCWMTLRKGEDNGNLKCKHQIALCEKLSLKVADLSSDRQTDRLRNERMKCFFPEICAV